MDSRGPGQTVVLCLERDRELGLLERAVQDALAGDAVLALFEGPAGIGKSPVGEGR